MRRENNQGNEDMKAICNVLMKETMFSYPRKELKKITSLANPQTVAVSGKHKSIEMYSIKKHM